MIAWIWVLIPLFGILCGIVAIYTEHRQKMAMIEKGIKPEELRRVEAHKPENMLIGGLVLIAIGFAFLLAQIVGGLTGWLMLPGFILLFIGIALTVSYYLIRKLKEE
jgi:hypothetical protein